MFSFLKKGHQYGLMYGVDFLIKKWTVYVQIFIEHYGYCR